MRKKWSHALVESELLSVISQLKRFPSVSDLKELGKNDLSCAMQRRGGQFYWSEIVGVSRQHSDSDFGWSGELKAAQMLRDRGFSVEKAESLRSPYDLIVNKTVTIDVKVANRAKYGACDGWFYRIGKSPTCDFIMLTRADVHDCFIIPSSIAPKTNVTISKSMGKYAKYHNAFELIVGHS